MRSLGRRSLGTGATALQQRTQSIQYSTLEKVYIYCVQYSSEEDSRESLIALSNRGRGLRVYMAVLCTLVDYLEWQCTRVIQCTVMCIIRLFRMAVYCRIMCTAVLQKQTNQNGTVLQCVFLHCAGQHCMQCTLLHCTGPYSVTVYCTALGYFPLLSTTMYFIAVQCSVLYCVSYGALQCTALYFLVVH